MRRLPPTLAALLLLLTACSGESALSTVTDNPATTAVTTTVATTTTMASTSTTTTAPTSPPAPEVLVSLPVGIDITYESGGEDLPQEGPSLITADPSGGIHIYDPVANRILSFNGGERTVIDLTARDILGVTALGSASDHLLVVEVFFGPVRQRVHRLGFDGTVRQSIDLPEGFRLEDGLSGVLSDTDDQIIVEYGGGAYYGIWLDEATSFQTSQTLTLGGTVIVSLPPDLEIAGATISANLSGDLGGLRYLGTAADGTHAVIRDEVRVTAGVFDVLTTVEWYSPTGAFGGSARVPDLQEQAIGSPPGIALLPDGRIVALVALPDEVRVVELQPVNTRITDLTESA